eukprot:PhM_4_TR8302/c0_g2_i1/m.24930
MGMCCIKPTNDGDVSPHSSASTDAIIIRNNNSSNTLFGIQSIPSLPSQPDNRTTSTTTPSSVCSPTSTLAYVGGVARFPDELSVLQEDNSVSSHDEAVAVGVGVGAAAAAGVKDCWDELLAAAWVNTRPTQADVRWQRHVDPWMSWRVDYPETWSVVRVLGVDRHSVNTVFVCPATPHDDVRMHVSVTRCFGQMHFPMIVDAVHSLPGVYRVDINEGLSRMCIKYTLRNAVEHAPGGSGSSVYTFGRRCLYVVQNVRFVVDVCLVVPSVALPAVASEACAVLDSFSLGGASGGGSAASDDSPSTTTTPRPTVSSKREINII